MSNEIANQFQAEAVKLRELHGSIMQHARMTLANAIEAGDTLMRVKAGLAHGQWLPWLKANVPFSDRTAEKYMRCYERRAELKTKFESDSNFSLSEAYALIEGTSQHAAAAQTREDDDEQQDVPLPGETLEDFDMRRLIEHEETVRRREESRMFNLPIEVERALRFPLDDIRAYKGKKYPPQRVTRFAKMLIRFGKLYITQGERLLREAARTSQP